MTFANPTCTTYCKFIRLIYQSIGYNTNVVSLEINMIIFMMLELQPIFNHTYQAHIGAQIVHKLRKLQSKWKFQKKFKGKFKTTTWLKLPKTYRSLNACKKLASFAKFWPCH